MLVTDVARNYRQLCNLMIIPVFHEGIGPIMNGPTGLVFCGGDEVNVRRRSMTIRHQPSDAWFLLDWDQEGSNETMEMLHPSGRAYLFQKRTSLRDC